RAREDSPPAGGAPAAAAAEAVGRGILATARWTGHAPRTPLRLRHGPPEAAGEWLRGIGASITVHWPPGSAWQREGLSNSLRTNASTNTACACAWAAAACGDDRTDRLGPLVSCRAAYFGRRTNHLVAPAAEATGVSPCAPGGWPIPDGRGERTEVIRRTLRYDQASLAGPGFGTCGISSGARDATIGTSGPAQRRCRRATRSASPVCRA